MLFLPRFPAWRSGAHAKFLTPKGGQAAAPQGTRAALGTEHPSSHPVPWVPTSRPSNAFSLRAITPLIEECQRMHCSIEKKALINSHLHTGVKPINPTAERGKASFSDMKGSFWRRHFCQSCINILPRRSVQLSPEPLHICQACLQSQCNTQVTFLSCSTFSTFKLLLSFI